MQIVFNADYLHEMPIPVFSCENKKKNIMNVLSAGLA